MIDQTDLDAAVVIALGGNLPSAGRSVRETLEAAIAALQADGFEILARSSWWTSRAWPNPDDPPFNNGVVIAKASETPQATLERLQRIEAIFGRQRDRPNAPRILDLDLIAHGRSLVDKAGLVVPHPRAHERAFVMRPLAEIASGWVHPGFRMPVHALVRRATIGADARPVDAASD